MDNPQLNIDRMIKHWVNTSDDDFNTMLVLYDSKIYHWPLFMGHISLEKLLKAYFVKTHQQHAPFTHNLFRLAEAAGIEVDDEHAEWLFKITAFNLNARYDDYKKRISHHVFREFCFGMD